MIALIELQMDTVNEHSSGSQKILHLDSPAMKILLLLFIYSRSKSDRNIDGFESLSSKPCRGGFDPQSDLMAAFFTRPLMQYRVILAL